MLSLVEAARAVASESRLRQLRHIPLYSNALHLFVANVATALLGLAFWVAASRFYSPEDVGLASALIASMSLLVLFSHLGLGVGLVRFLPPAGKRAPLVINTAFTVGILTSMAAGFIFAIGTGFWSPALLLVRDRPIFLAAFVLFTVASNLAILVDDTFVAARQAGFVLARGLIFSLLRLLLLILLPALFHAFGIIASWGISLWVSLLLCLLWLLPRVQPTYRPRPTISLGVLRELLPFSVANQLAAFLWLAPGMLLPLIVVNAQGAESNAYFYIAITTGSVLGMIPGTMSTSLFAEGSNEEATLGLNTWRSLKAIFVLLVPAVIFIVAFGDKLLLLFGQAYSENASTLLRIIAISSLPMTVNLIYLAVKRVEQRLLPIMALSTFLAMGTVGLTSLLLPRMGINGAGIATLATHGSAALLILTIWLKRGRAWRRVGVIVSSKLP